MREYWWHSGKRWTSRHDRLDGFALYLVASAFGWGGMGVTAAEPGLAPSPLAVTLRHQVETSPGSGRFHRLTRAEAWAPSETALIVCDVWDSHHCRNAVRRVEEMVPRLDAFVAALRRQGVTIIHAPSGCMAFYADHPARHRAQTIPRASKLPADIGKWCYQIPAEERAVYPLDQKEGGEDDDPAEHAAWAAELAAKGLNPRAPWTRQHAGVAIDADRDFVSDNGEEIWSILESHGRKNVLIAGVHTNMCVLGRPFGLRRMASNGKNTALVRDLTDTMYDPNKWPYVSHFTGTDLIVDHIERYVCATLSSDQILGGAPLRFSRDTRPHVLMLLADDEYKSEATVPAFALRELGDHFRVSYVFGSDRPEERHSLPGLASAEQPDLLLVSVRRRLLPESDLARIKRWVQAGTPVIGIRTASHAFSVRGERPAGVSDWPEFDAAVFGGNYHGHHGNALKSTVTWTEAEHPLLAGIDRRSFAQGWSLYQVSPLRPGTTVLATARLDSAPDVPTEPVAWTFQRADGGRSFYTSLGHEADFQQPAFVQLLRQACFWALDRPLQPRRERPTP